MIVPVPLQRSHIVTLTIWPSIVERTWRSSPLPWHLGHVTGALDGSAPAAGARLAARQAVNSISFSAPLIDSANVSWMS